MFAAIRSMLAIGAVLLGMPGRPCLVGPCPLPGHVPGQAAVNAADDCCPPGRPVVAQPRDQGGAGPTSRPARPGCSDCVCCAGAMPTLPPSSDSDTLHAKRLDCPHAGGPVAVQVRSGDATRPVYTLAASCTPTATDATRPGTRPLLI